MAEKNIITRSTTPVTVTSLTEQLRACGLATGQTVLVHMAMSKLGWIIGGAEAVILALLAAVGDSGTIMMPTYSSSNIEPRNAQHPPIPEAWWQAIRDHTPVYNPLTTPTSEIGVVPELLRTWPGAVRSAHPAFSLAARGPNAIAARGPNAIAANIIAARANPNTIERIWQAIRHKPPSRTHSAGLFCDARLVC